MGENDSSDPLNTVFSGAAILMIGYVLGGVLTLTTKVVVARLFSSELYGVFSQGMSLLFTLVMVSMLGLNAGISRFISYNSDKNDDKASSAVSSSLAAIIPASIIIFGLLYVFAEPISTLGFQDSRTAMVLKVFAISGPFLAINSMFISGFRGYKKSKQRVILLDFVVPALQLLGIVLLVFLGYGFYGATVGFAAAFIATSLIAFLWYRQNHSLTIQENVVKELILFSWPLMISAIAVQIFLWSPSIIVGLLSTSKDVGLLNTALPLGAATKMFLSSVAFLFMPVASDLFSNNDLEEMKEVYSAATRWIVTFSVPVLMFLFFLPEQSIAFLFGSEYAEAGAALSIMVLGFIINMVTGPVGELLIAVGKTKKEAFANVTKLGVFLALSFLTVPEYGFLGGAVSFALGMIVGNLLRLWFCWEYIGMFFNFNYLKPFLAVAPAILSALVVQGIAGFLPISIIVFSTSYLSVLALMRPIEERDKILIQDFRSKLGLENIVLIDSIIEKLS